MGAVAGVHCIAAGCCHVDPSILLYIVVPAHNMRRVYQVVIISWFAGGRAPRMGEVEEVCPDCDWVHRLALQWHHHFEGTLPLPHTVVTPEISSSNTHSPLGYQHLQRGWDDMACFRTAILNAVCSCGHCNLLQGVNAACYCCHRVPVPQPRAAVIQVMGILAW